MLKQITFTGADDNTNIIDLLALSSAYPFVEWGILLPGIGKPRFPSMKWLETLIGRNMLEGEPAKLSGHICPPLTAKILHSLSSIDNLVGHAFSRIQINTHGEKYLYDDKFFKNLHESIAREIIFQLDGANDNLLNQASHYPWLYFTGLIDGSHGGGVLPEHWPKPYTFPQIDCFWIGYSGGLGPHNLERELPKILEAAGDHNIWIDMETHVRTNGEFDLEKVVSRIKIAEKWMS